MLFLVWLLASFVAVGAINLYLRYFGLPRATTGSGAATGGKVGLTPYGQAPLGGGPGARGGGTGWLGGGGCVGGVGESVGWFNAAAAWVHGRSNQTPDFVDAWLRALTTEAERQQHQRQSQTTPPGGLGGSGAIRLRFDGVHGSAPELSGVQADTTASDMLTIYANLSAKEVTLQLCCLDQSAPATPPTPGSAPTSGQVVNCDARLQWVTGQVKLVVRMVNNELSLSISFVQPPDIRLQVRPARINAPLDTALVEGAVRAAIGGATTVISWQSRPRPEGPPGGARGGSQYRPGPLTSLGGVVGDPRGAEEYRGGSAGIQGRQAQPYSLQGSLYRDLNPGATPQSPIGGSYAGPSGGQLSPSLDVAQPASLAYGSRPGPSTGLSQQQQQQQQQQQMLHQQQQQLLQQQQRPAGDRNAQRLLVKVIKANGLVDTDWGSCSAYCLVRLDQPPQSYMTNVIRNTVNPLWDEQFVFDLDPGTKWVQFEVLDRDKQPDSDLLGKAVVVLDEIRRMPSSRQIIPLTGRPRSRTSTSGSVTVEVVFLDPMEYTGPSGPLPTNVYNVSSQQPTTGQHGGQQPIAVQHAGQQPIGQPDASRTGSYYKDSSKPGSPQTQISGDYSPYPGGRGRPGGTGAGGSEGGYPGALSAHDLALGSTTHPGAPGPMRGHQESPSLVITQAEGQRGGTMGGMRSNTDMRGKEKKESFAETLRKKFALKKGPRAQSVDRYQTSSLRGESTLLRPPPSAGNQPQGGQLTLQAGSKVADQSTLQYGEGRQVRSNSIGSSIRRIFRGGDKKDKLASREGSLTRSVGRGGGPQREIITEGTYQGGGDRGYRGGTPVPPGREGLTAGGGSGRY